jgi:co-chaperonin GroES (HSP10)
MVDYGMRMGNETITGVPAAANIRPLRDQIVLEPMEWEPSKIIAVAYSGRPLRGKVRAVGPGVYPKRYDGPKGKRTKTWDSKAFRPCDVKAGDVVELGGVELGGYLMQTFWWGNKEMVLCREEDVAIVVD